MRFKNSFPFLLTILLFCSCEKESNGQSPEGNDKYTLVWADEFDYNGRPDPAKWTYEMGQRRNHEKQYYTDSLKNARVENGNLIIEGHKTRFLNPNFVDTNDADWKQNQKYLDYTSASISTEHLAEWKYGIIEVKAKLPKGVGQWPAIWMLGKNIDQVGWPKSGEIDIMEQVGYEPEVVHGTVHTETYNHTKGTQKGQTVFIDNPYDEFHVFAVEWTPEKIDFLLDGKVYFVFNNDNKSENEWPFDQPFYLKLNIAIGGDWGGIQGIDDSVFPQKMTVDYVRVYQKKK
ncbi:glycoside hydrolase family 16 protein [Flavobacteriaceae bacterium F89]|uniref:Glycoside hydrolase family 16 protein n=1 Tax=Cerina litoralis TaxID=2874477 RepID=A0AAE3EUL0_9FLAO|nr:glycoside hydrolase family 16 protein [Cerina litoralis]MCG2460653.1 glycoside hydrolase family 16 protein [Cerina litoralis]